MWPRAALYNMAGRGLDTHELEHWFPIFFFHLRTHWQPISINCTLHISKMFVISIVAVSSNLYVIRMTLKKGEDTLI